MISSNVLAYGLGLFAHMTSQMPARRHEQSTAIQAALAILFWVEPGCRGGPGSNRVELIYLAVSPSWPNAAAS